MPQLAPAPARDRGSLVEGSLTLQCRDCRDLQEVPVDLIVRPDRTRWVLHDEQYEVLGDRVLHVGCRLGSVPTYLGYAGAVLVLRSAVLGAARSH
jgi:hypothetical protein